MESAEDASLEAAIRWLVGTILGVLLMDKMDAWIRGVKLHDDVAELKFEVERAESLIDDVRGRAHGNKSLVRSLARLKELLYDADDMVDVLDYYRLQQQVEGVRRNEPEEMHVTEPADGVTNEMSTGHADTPKRVRKPRSKTWDYFKVHRIDNKPTATCNYCGESFNCDTKKNGLTSMTKHIKNICKKKPAGELPPNPSSTGDAPGNVTATEVATSSRRKRKRADKEPAQTTAAITHTPWDKAELSNRIKRITSQLQGILEALSKLLEGHGSGCASSFNRQQSTTLDQNLRTSSLLPGKVYGRDAEKDFIIKLITEDQSDVVTVLPIVGIAGLGKTALAQLVYNDSEMESKFHHRIWVWMSHNFDEVRITREMLDFFPRGTHEGISSFARLQEILKEHMKNHTEYQSKKFLLILDDVWDNLDDHRWNKLLAPLIASQVTGNVILVTTRNLSVAKRLGTLNPVKLSALAYNDFWLLFKSCAFGNENYEGNQRLLIIGRQIADKLKGNPLAAETAGGLLKKDLSVDHWNNILKEEHWKSLQLSRGIMPTLKLSYDQLTYPSQQCFSYISIYPSSYCFHGEELVRIWISQGFVNKCDHPSKKLEDIAQYYLTELVNLGFFQQVEVSTNPSYAISGVMHDFARIVSRTDCAAIDGLPFDEILPTVHHLSILTGYAYIKGQHKVLRNEKFEENLRNAVTSVSKLRTLVLLGHYDSFSLQMFKDIFQKAQNLRLLQIYAAGADFNSLVPSLANPAHLRYLKHNCDDFTVALPQGLIKFFHLQVLDVRLFTNHTVPDGMHNLVSMRHLVAENGGYPKIANMGSMTSLQELEFKVQLSSSGFEIAQLQSMNMLVQLGLSQLHRVKTGEEACGVRLREKIHLEKLHLSWKATSSDEEYSSDASSESNEELLPMDYSGPSSEPSVDTAREVLESLEPHMNLKHLQISGYNGTASPSWLASNIAVTSLQTLHLDDCGGWRILPSLERLRFLTKLKLSSMPEVTEVLVPSLEELVLVEMPKLERCSCTSVKGLRSSLRVLQIEKCHAIKVFDLLEKDDEFEIERRTCLPGIRKLILHDCPHLKVLKTLPPSTTCSVLLISEVSTLPYVDGSSSKLQIGFSNELSILDDKILAFHNLRNLKSMSVTDCGNLSYILFEGFCQLVSLKRLEIWRCEQLFSSVGMPEDVTIVSCKAFPSLEKLKIVQCGIHGKWLSLMLRHAPELEKLSLSDCPHITTVLLPKEEEENSDPDEPLTGLAQDRHLHIPSNAVSSLKKLHIKNCNGLTFNGSKGGFSVFTSLEKLKIRNSPGLLSSLVHTDGSDVWANGRLLLPKSLGTLYIQDYPRKTLQLCFLSSLTSLKKLTVRGEHVAGLESLQLEQCTALEELKIFGRSSLATLEGLQSLGSLRHLAVYNCPGLRPCLESVSRQGYGLCSWLETLDINDPSVLTTSLCVGLTSLQRLKLQDLVLTEEQGSALVLLTSLQQLEFRNCYNLLDLSAGLHLLPSLKKLKIIGCQRISWLAETDLPLSLEELEIELCSKKLADQCRLLATSKLNVKIGYCPH